MKRLLSALLCAVFLLLPACREEPDPFPDVLLAEAAWTAPDGTKVALWDSFATNLIYRLEDGTDLLRHDTFGPRNVHVGGLEGFHGLDDAVQEAVEAYYEDRGLLFDLDEQIALAYADWQDAQATGREFYCHTAEQAVVPCYETERHTGFVTEVTLPVNPAAFDRVVTRDRSTLFFDRATGELADPWSFFTVPQEEAVQFLLNLHPDKNPAVQQALLDTFQPEWLVWSQDSLTIDYPAGALAGQGIETAFLLGFDYGDLKEILHPWAIPEAPDT